jgi:apolipoprotein N-acyltransferase
VQSALVAGFNTELDGAQHNVSLGFLPGEHNPVIYEKRRLVPVLETKYYTPGPGPKLLSNFIGLEICKDMDFPGMLREDETATRPLLLAVPAWDFDKDDWSHARVAVMRSVENGVPMARTARDGLLTLNDRYGTIVARARAVAGFTTLIGDLRLGGSGGGTIYDRIGDAFGWLCVATSAALLGLSFAQRTGRRGRWTSAQAAIARLSRRSKQVPRKQFFFEKKNQKTFTPFSLYRRIGFTAKRFLFF